MKTGPKNSLHEYRDRPDPNPSGGVRTGRRKEEQGDPSLDAYLWRSNDPSSRGDRRGSTQARCKATQAEPPKHTRNEAHDPAPREDTAEKTGHNLGGARRQTINGSMQAKWDKASTQTQRNKARQTMETQTGYQNA